MQMLEPALSAAPVEAVEAVAAAARDAGIARYDWTSLTDAEALERLDARVGDALEPIVRRARASLEDPQAGIFVIDVPELPERTKLEDMWAGSVTALLIARRLSPLRTDARTRLPFTIYNASAEGERALKANGIRYFSPEQNLGFHTDGIVDGGSLWSPRFVSIYNVYFGYRKPGNFFWVPFARWEQYDEWRERLAEHRFRLEITPITYRDSSGKLNVASDGEYVVSLLARAGATSVPFFNGEVVACESDPSFDVADIKRMLASISSNGQRFAVPLRARRLFLLNNWLGAHARDIFEDPLPTTKYTRSFFRAMGTEKVAV